MWWNERITWIEIHIPMWIFRSHLSTSTVSTFTQKKDDINIWHSFHIRSEIVCLCVCVFVVSRVRQFLFNILNKLITWTIRNILQIQCLGLTQKAYNFRYWFLCSVQFSVDSGFWVPIEHFDSTTKNKSHTTIVPYFMIRKTKKIRLGRTRTDQNEKSLQLLYKYTILY